MTSTTTINTADASRIAAALAWSAAGAADATAIVNAGLVHATGKPGIWLVRSVTNEDQWYATTLASCTCVSHLNRGHCKHQTAVLVLLLADALPAGHRTPVPGFPPGYDPALAPAPAHLNDGLRGELFAALRARYGRRLLRDERLDKLSLLLSREITSVHDLTADEARHVIVALRTLGN